MTNRNDPAEMRKAQFTPKASSRTPASAGPMALAMLFCNEFRVTPDIRSPRGTRSLMNADQAGMVRPLKRAIRPTRHRITEGSRTSKRVQAAHINNVEAIIPNWAKMMSLRLLILSASAPPMGPMMTPGTY